MTPTQITSFPTAGHKPNPLVRRAMKLIETQACDGLTVKEIARELGVSRLTLHREFLIHLSKTPAQMLKLTRMNAATTLLATTELPVKQIARMAGFGRASNFSAVFRRYQGQSPSGFRSASGHGKAVPATQKKSRSENNKIGTMFGRLGAGIGTPAGAGPTYRCAEDSDLSGLIGAFSTAQVRQLPPIDDFAGFYAAMIQNGN